MFIYALYVSERPDVGVTVTYGGGDTCMRRVVQTKPKKTSGGSGKSPDQEDEVEEIVSWVPTERSLTMKITCDPTDTGVFDPASLMQMMRKVHVAEDEMCAYVLDWRGRPITFAHSLGRPITFVYSIGRPITFAHSLNSRDFTDV